MDHLLSLSQAARMVGATRHELQRHVQEGRIRVFEGSIRLSELQKVYPEAGCDARSEAMLEKTRRIMQSAAQKYSPGRLPDRRELANEVHRLRLQLAQAQQELAQYDTLTAELHARLQSLHEQCDKREKVLLQGISTWLLHQMKQHQH